MMAAIHNCHEIANYLVWQGVDVKKTDESGDSAWHWAAYTNHVGIMLVLCGYGGHDVDAVDAHGQNALHLATGNNAGAAVVHMLSLPQVARAERARAMRRHSERASAVRRRRRCWR